MTDHAQFQPPAEVWVVFDDVSADEVFENRRDAMDAALEFSERFPNMAPWHVERYIRAAPAQPATDNAALIDDVLVSSAGACDCSAATQDVSWHDRTCRYRIMRAAAAALAAAEARIKELEQSFDLRWKADMRAIKRWQAERQERKSTWPDHADLCVWLLHGLEQASAQAEANAKDAERYRWLRESHLDERNAQISSVQFLGDELAFDELDAAIDAAIAREKK